MEKIAIPKLSDKIKNAKRVREIHTEEYEKAVEEANEKIRESRRREAEAWINASKFISD